MKFKGMVGGCKVSDGTRRGVPESNRTNGVPYNLWNKFIFMWISQHAQHAKRQFNS